MVRRVTGRSVGRFIAEEIAAPLGLSVYVGLPAEQEHRVAEMSGDDSIYVAHVAGEKTAYPCSFRNPELFAETPNARAWRAAEIPAANGHADARSLARLYATLAIGGGLAVAGALLYWRQLPRIRHAIRPVYEKLGIPAREA